jgi:hypothetical protein
MHFTRSKFSPEEFQRVMVDGAIRHGLEWVGGNPIERKGYSLLALSLPIERQHYNDFHWYRKDDGGRWSRNAVQPRHEK